MTDLRLPAPYGAQNGTRKPAPCREPGRADLHLPHRRHTEKAECGFLQKLRDARIRLTGQRRAAKGEVIRLSRIALGTKKGKEEPEMEEQARAAWKAALGSDEFTDDSNFFELGGDSAGALSVIMTLEDDYNIYVEADILFGNPNFGDFVSALQAAVDEQKSFEL